jgi:nucleoside phosphorylase
MAAAKAMLDETYDRLAQPRSDHNTYTLGRLYGHDIVIALLPIGVCGVTSATRALAEMMSTFPSLRFGLMVGVGGGVPSIKADIRLGDVVVSKPTDYGSGVIPYDYGKILHDGRIQCTGFLNKPPQVLLTAVGQLESDHLIRKRQIKQTISGVLEKNEEMKNEFCRPQNDWLFCATYLHETSRFDCSACDLKQLVPRQSRTTDEPSVHYGLVGSGNKVMKDAKTRDQIAREQNILCFEMEAAGVMDQLPCLVIRGICDYCDSHKNQEWQGYAALTAAAYAKLVLSVTPLTWNKTYRRQGMYYLCLRATWSVFHISRDLRECSRHTAN